MAGRREDPKVEALRAERSLNPVRGRSATPPAPTRSSSTPGTSSR